MKTSMGLSRLLGMDLIRELRENATVPDSRYASNDAASIKPVARHARHLIQQYEMLLNHYSICQIMAIPLDRADNGVLPRG